MNHSSKGFQKICRSSWTVITYGHPHDSQTIISTGNVIFLLLELSRTCPRLVKQLLSCRAANSDVGCRMTVIPGCTNSAVSKSSKPMIDNSPGTQTRCLRTNEQDPPQNQVVAGKKCSCLVRIKTLNITFEGVSAGCIKISIFREARSRIAEAQLL